jgi:predicted dehydrogenase
MHEDDRLQKKITRLSELKIGIVGFGGAGLAQYHHFRDLKCEIASVFDPKPAGRERARQLSPSVATPLEFDAFLNSGIDAVSICSPDRTHAEYFARSIRAGKHTIAEKPLTDSLEGCCQILSAISEYPQCVAAVQHQMRFLPIHLAMKEIVGSGELGRIAYLEGYYIHNLTERAYLYDTWRFSDRATPLVYSGCHFVDLLRWLLDDEVVEVIGMANNIAFAQYPESDTNVILMRFRSGVLGKVVTAFGFGRPQDHSVRVYGSDKCIENNLLFAKDGNFSVFARPKWRLGLTRMGIKLRATNALFERVMKKWRLPDEYSISFYPLRLYEHRFAVRASLSDFVEAICDRRPPRCSVLDAAKTVATCLAGVEAYRTGRTVLTKKYWLPEFGPIPVLQAAKERRA